MRVGRNVADLDQAKRVTVGGRLRNELNAQVAGGSAAIFDNDGLAERAAEIV